MSRYCLQCGKANNACICDWIKPIDCSVRVVILQHPSESKRPVGTAKILQLSLSHCDIWVGEDFSQHSELNVLLQDEQTESLILYPNDNSQSLDSVALRCIELAAENKRLCLILLDGTWKKAYKMWRLSSNLHSLPCVALPNHLQGNYRIRKAPTEQHLSTVEAGFYALSAIKPQVDFSPLVTAFTNMVDFQISQMPEGVFERNYNP
ncbi:tRNA-uridine aminocarboxypropyltransferase [Vibrio sp.]|uniref:tRNA-uridine aminocarboxypropyltransferase n=1 Tax=Vibrio sp. TaxID=678 RepID=UPI003AA8A999